MTTWTQALHDALDAPAVQRRPIALRRGAILRLDHARGTVVRAASGSVWITEERRLADAVLAAGEEQRIAGSGRVVVAADRASRVVLEWPGGRAAPRIELAAAEGEPGRLLGSRTDSVASWLASLWAPGASPPRHPATADHSPEAVRDRLAALMPLLRA